MGDSGRASKITAEAYPDKIEESVLIQSKSLKSGAPEYRAVVADVEKRLDGTQGRIAGPWPVRQGPARQPHLRRRPFGPRQLRGQG